MEKSNTEKVKDFLLYAPVGAFGFIKDNAPTFFNVFVSRGKRDVNKSAMVAEEKLAESKEKGQIVAMGTPIAKEQAEQFVEQAKEEGESFANAAAQVAGAALSVAGDFFSSLVEMVTSDDNENKANSSQSSESTKQDTANENLSTNLTDGSLPIDLESKYDSLSAPEIIEILDNYSREDLLSIQRYESGFRNRQTIIHAIAYRLNA